MAKMAKVLIPVILSLLLLSVMGCARKPPTITSISPSKGPSGGGTKVTITGENFKEGATVTIAGKPLKNMSINKEGTSVTGTTPGGPPGPQQVIARNPKAKNPSAPVTFTYEALTVINTTPADGSEVPWKERVTQVSATFSQDIQSGSASISISGVTGEVSYDASTRTVTITTSKPLRTGQSYEVTVSGAKDLADNVMDDYKFSFSIQEAEKVDWYTVQEGDTLPIIAAKPEVYEDETKWMLIYEANQDEFVSEDGEHGNDIILDYKNLIPGMELYIPR